MCFYQCSFVLLWFSLKIINVVFERSLNSVDFRMAWEPRWHENRMILLDWLTVNKKHAWHVKSCCIGSMSKRNWQMWLSYHGHGFCVSYYMAQRNWFYAVVAVPFRCSAVQQCQVQRSCHRHPRPVRTRHHIPVPLVTGTPSRRCLHRLCMTLDQHCHGDQRLERVHTPAVLHLTINLLTCQTPEPVSCRHCCCICVVCRSSYKSLFTYFVCNLPQLWFAASYEHIHQNGKLTEIIYTTLHITWNNHFTGSHITLLLILLSV